MSVPSVLPSIHPFVPSFGMEEMELCFSISSSSSSGSHADDEEGIVVSVVIAVVSVIAVVVDGGDFAFDSIASLFRESSR